jgi:galactokinase
VVVAPRDEDRVRLATADFEGAIEYDGVDLAPGRAKDWSRYVPGVMAGLVHAGEDDSGLGDGVEAVSLVAALNLFQQQNKSA